MLFAAAGLELGVAAAVFRHREARWAPLLILWLAAVLGAYRAGLWTVGFQGHCPCLGHVFDFDTGASVWINRASVGALGVMALGSLYSMAVLKRKRLPRNRQAAALKFSIILLMFAFHNAQAFHATNTHSIKEWFAVMGTLKSQTDAENLPREVSYHVVVSDGSWRIQLLASEPSAIFKTADFGGNGKEIYLISRDWNGGTLAHVGTSSVPYPGSIEEHAVLWSVYALACSATRVGLVNLENPFSNRLPRPWVNFILHDGRQDGLLFEFLPMNRDSHRLPSSLHGSGDPTGRCIVHEWIKIPGSISLPKNFEVEIDLSPQSGERAAIRKYHGIVTNFAQELDGSPMLPSMPEGITLTFLDTRYNNLANPIAIGAFPAKGIWPSPTDLEAIPEYRAWLSASQFSSKSHSLAGMLFLLSVLIFTALMIWRLKNGKTTKERENR